MKRQVFFAGLVALAVSLISIGVYEHVRMDGHVVKVEHIEAQPSLQASYTHDDGEIPIPLDFNRPAKKVLGGVVHIKSTQLKHQRGMDEDYGSKNPLGELFGPRFEEYFGPQFRFQDPRQNSGPQRSPARVGTGSGVVISEDGYIVTNNHVIANADDIEVTLHDNRVYKAKIIGTDPSTDLALLQIKEKNLPTVPFYDSDQVDIGQWVLAVGNPMGLNSTVTAGIVSAKGRNINILRDKYAIENFIQTDAAINPGNSGGALVNLDGGLVGINTAIASPTGAFTGYGFAVPTNIVKKVVEDLLEYGVVQRGVLGVMIRSIDGNLAKEKDLDVTKGVFVDSLLENSAAAKSGINAGDVILKVEEINVNTSAELQGLIARYRPGDEVSLLINRRGKEKEISVTLNNREGNRALSTKEHREMLQMLGADFEALDQERAEAMQVEGGVRIKKLYPGKLRKYTDVREGFIVTKVDGKTIKDIDDLVDAIDSKKGGVMLEGVYEDIPGTYYYAFGV